MVFGKKYFVVGRQRPVLALAMHKISSKGRQAPDIIEPN
jgi:hypothetical protein